MRAGVKSVVKVIQLQRDRKEEWMMIDMESAGRIMDLIRMDDRDFYDHYVDDLGEEEKDGFLREFPEFEEFRKPVKKEAK